MRRVGAAVVLVTACVVGGVVLMLTPVSIRGSYPPVPGPGGTPPAPVESCPAGIAGTGWGILLSPSPDVQVHPRRTYQFAECHDAAVQRAFVAGSLVGFGLVLAVILYIWKPGLLDQAAGYRRRDTRGEHGAPGLTAPVGLAAAVLGVGCLLGGFLWIASSA